jgi:hypothetical protein
MFLVKSLVAFASKTVGGESDGIRQRFGHIVWRRRCMLNGNCDTVAILANATSRQRNGAYCDGEKCLSF